MRQELFSLTSLQLAQPIPVRRYSMFNNIRFRVEMLTMSVRSWSKKDSFISY